MNPTESKNKGSTFQGTSGVRNNRSPSANHSAGPGQPGRSGGSAMPKGTYAVSGRGGAPSRTPAHGHEAERGDGWDMFGATELIDRSALPDASGVPDVNTELHPPPVQTVQTPGKRYQASASKPQPEKDSNERKGLWITLVATIAGLLVILTVLIRAGTGRTKDRITETASGHYASTETGAMPTNDLSSLLEPTIILTDTPMPQNRTTETPEQPAISDSSPAQAQVLQANRFPFQAKTTVGRVNIRALPGKGSRLITTIVTAGTIVTVEGDAVDENGDHWYRITSHDGYEGYIMSSYLQEVDTHAVVLDTRTESAQAPTQTQAPADSGGGIYGLVVQPLVTRSGPSGYFDETGTFDLMGQQVKVLARAYDALSGTWWVKCEIPVNGQVSILWTNYFRFDPDSLPLKKIPIE